MTQTDQSARISALADRVVRSAFQANPAHARAAGDHTFDGVVPQVGPDWPARRIADLESLSAELHDPTIDEPPAGSDLAADLGVARIAVADELFHLRVLRDPQTDPQWALWRGCDVSSYITRDYAPLGDRAEALVRHLEKVPGWIEAAGALLEPELATGPRDIAVDSVRGHATFYRDEVRRELGDLGNPDVGRRLDAAIEAAAAACDRHAARLEAAAPRLGWALGAERFTTMLRAQEGVEETVPALRASADAELSALTARGEEVAARMGAASLSEAFARMEEDHPSRDDLLDTASGMLRRLRDFWIDRDVLTVPVDVECTVRRSPSFYSFITAAFESPGYLDPVTLPHFYYVTPVDPSWSDEQAEGWLRHLNNACLENISVHEVYPGHFVQAVDSFRGAGLLRNAFWYGGFGEGWAHYTELLAIEQGLAEDRPALELAMVQDALLRAARFSATVGMHAEGMSVDEATRMFEARAYVPRIAAEREAVRGTWDPMYLVYTYGKLEILRWRQELGARQDFDLKRFHDRMIGAGAIPLAVMRDFVMGADAR
jgi:hypothetical protein